MEKRGAIRPGDTPEFELWTAPPVSAEKQAAEDKDRARRLEEDHPLTRLSQAARGR